ncbi:dienelactone hydrolase family protein [Caulobacter sp. NIBR2454]|uniref:dienelactone hydrolase family protein n=1 Tax=Caulobacter sp. NIBR2454 TaxID=3015996 RepID=UPI0022B6B0A7|nr:dienelactone hydrolase family protein [Caulobacter sp. NIBR2454]
MASQTVKIATPDGEFSAYVARPSQPKAPAVVVIQEIFGVNAVMREIADGLASVGYLAICPDLFWRVEPGVDITDQSEAEWKKAFALMNAFDTDKGIEDIQATIDFIRQDEGSTGKVGAVGFCLGGKLAYLTATRTNVNASVSYYGVGIENLTDEAAKIRMPLLMHIAEADQFVPPAAQEKIIAALKDHPKVEIHTYPGRDHAFARKGGEHYDGNDAAVAQIRTQVFLQNNLA